MQALQVTVSNTCAGILIEVYSPLLPLTDKSTAPEVAAFRAEVDKIAAAYSKTPAQVGNLHIQQG
jgi:diketogulonate reductase-like aldo/keto reductase